MATVRSRTQISIDDLIGETVVSGYVEDGVLILVNRDGAEIFAGDVMTGSPLQAWPVGSVFISVVPTSPTTLLGGGTWVAFGTGRMLVGVNPADADWNTVEETGGSKTHTLTKSMVPTHVHDIGHDHANTTFSVEYTDATAGGAGAAVRVTDIDNQTGGGGTNATASVNIVAMTGNSGDGSADSLAGAAVPNVPPYISVYMWKRTA